MASEVELSVISLIAGSGSTLTRQEGIKERQDGERGGGCGVGGDYLREAIILKYFRLRGAYLITYSWSDYFSL